MKVRRVDEVGARGERLGWKQRALYDAVKAAAASGLVRLSKVWIYDAIDGQALDRVLYGRATVDGEALQTFVRSRASV